MLSTSYDNTVAVWELKEGGALHELSRYYFKYTVDGIAIAPSHHTIILAERNQPFLTYIDWTTQAKKEVSINQHDWDLHVSFCITDCALMGDERYVVALTDKSNVIVFPYERNEHVQSLYVSSMLSDSYYMGSIALDAREQNAILTCSDNTIRVFSLYSGKEVQVLKGHSKLVRNMFYFDDLRPQLFSCSYDHTIRVWTQCSLVCSQTRHSEIKFFSSGIIISPTFTERIAACASTSGSALFSALPVLFL